MKAIVGFWIGLCVLGLYAQPPGIGERPFSPRRGGGEGGDRSDLRQEEILKGSIRGILKDSASQEPLPYVPVSLYRGDKLITGALSDEKGAFVLREVPIGRLRLHIQPLGYAPTEKIVETTPLRPDLNLGTIFLTETGVTLQAVEIQAERNPIEYQPEKIVYTPDKDATVQGGDALDVLRKVPTVNVDLEGRIEVRGSGAVRIYVDGKPSLLFSSNPAEALRAVPADQIERIELITNPSARYEAEGAVILNIVLKRNRLEGISLTANAGITTQIANGSATVGAKVGRWSHTLNVGGRYRYAGVGFSYFMREQQTPLGITRLRQEGTSFPRRYSTNLTYSGEFIKNAAHIFSWGLSYRDLLFDRMNDLTVRWEGGPWNGAEYVRKARFPSTDRSVNANIDWTHRFPAHPERELQVSLQGGYQGRRQFYTMDQLASLDTFYLRERSRNQGPSWESQVQIDYTHPIQQRWKIETGLRFNFRSLATGYFYERYHRPSESFLPVPGRQDTLRYAQFIPAAYFSLSWAKDRWLIKGGVRYELTANQGSFLRGTLPIRQTYHNFFPNLLLSYRVKGLFPLQVSYSQRIRRPWLQELNPFIDASDPRNIQYGNPYLDPELTHAVELSFFPYISLFARYSTGVVQEYSFVDAEGITHTTYLNSGERGFYGANLFYRRTFWNDKITLQANGELAWVDVRADVGRRFLRNTGWQYQVRGSLQWRPAKGWLVELSGNYNSPRISLQGIRPVFMFQELGVRKTFAQGRWSIGGILYNPFYQYLRLTTRLRTADFYQESVNGIPFRVVGVQVRYQQVKMGENFWRRRRGSGQTGDDDEW